MKLTTSVGQIVLQDYIPHQRSRQCGPRVLTFFLYLSDVEVGGGTDFPDLGITVRILFLLRILGRRVVKSVPH